MNRKGGGGLRKAFRVKGDEEPFFLAGRSKPFSRAAAGRKGAERLLSGALIAGEIPMLESAQQSRLSVAPAWRTAARERWPNTAGLVRNSKPTDPGAYQNSAIAA